MKPYFSIIIPTYNRGYCIGNLIESVLIQKFKEFELIIVDDGSTDKTSEVVAGFKDNRIIYKTMGKNMGANAARNVGAKMARGEWIISNDSDDLFSDGGLEIAYDLTKKIDADLIFAACVDLDGKITSNNPKFEGFISFRDYLKGSIIKGEYIPIIKTASFSAIGFYFEDIMGGEGITWARFIKKNGRAYFSNKIVRIYNNKGSDRFSIKSKNFRRLAGVFKKDLSIFWEDYLIYSPLTLFMKLLKFFIYKFLSIIKMR